MFNSGLKAAVVGGAFAISSAVPAFAQDSVDLPVTARIIANGDFTELALVNEGRLPDISRSRLSHCVYSFEASGVSYFSDNGVSETGPGFDNRGCGYVGTFTAPTIEMSCPDGREVILIATTVENLGVNSDITISPWYAWDADTQAPPTSTLLTGSGGYAHHFDCPDAQNGSGSSLMSFSFGMRVVLNADENPVEETVNGAIPLEVIY